MTTKHHLTHAEQLFWGAAYDEALSSTNGRKGVRINVPTRVVIGTPEIGDVDSMIDAATSTELPNTETVTYTPDTDGTTPTDGVQGTATVNGVLYWELDVPRNIVCQTTHGSSIVAMTIVVTGLDEYKKAISETITVAATGTDESDVGLKAFKWVRSIAITAAGDAEANTLNVGFGDVIGMPYRVNNKDEILVFENGVPVSTGTFVAAVTTDPATATSGDVRGTLDPTMTLDGSKRLVVEFFGLDPTSRETLLGVDQYGG